MTATAAPFATITARLGVHVATTQHASQRAAEIAARKAIRSGKADSAAVWTATDKVAIFGAGR
ncbi:hypothetical protein AB0J27_20455 [Micromonospora chokoriensis]